MVVPSDPLQFALEHRVDVLARWLVFWTAIVVIGLFWEYGADFAKKLKPSKNKRKFLWVSLYAFMGGPLVVAGVAGELYAEFFASKAEFDLRQYSDTANLDLSKLVGKAQTSADNAALNAGKAVDSAHRATLQAKDVEARAGKLVKQEAALEQVENKLDASQQELARRQNPRWRNLLMDADKISAALKGKPVSNLKFYMFQMTRMVSTLP